MDNGLRVMNPGYPLPIVVAFVFLFTAATALAQKTTLVTVATENTRSAGGLSEDPVMSANGRFVAFHSFSSDLVLLDLNGRRDVFVRDLQNGTTTLVSVNLSGTGTGNGTSERPTISDNGRFVVFESDASNLVPNDTNGQIDVFVRDLQTSTTTLVSANSSNNGGGNQASFDAVISPDARYVAFTSAASDLVTFDNNNTVDVFVRDVSFAHTRMVSCDFMCTSPGNDSSFMPNVPKDKAARAVFSADGIYLVFESRATNLVDTPDANGHSPDVFVRNLDIGLTNLMSINSTLSASANGGSTTPIISRNGRFVFFQSVASDLTPNDPSGGLDLFVRDRNTSLTSLVSVTTANTGSNIHSNSHFFPVASADGRYVIFQSDSNAYVVNDSNINIDVFRRDLETNTTALVSVDVNGGTTSNSAARGSVMSADGRFVAFTGFGNVQFSSTPDSNGIADVFVRDMNAGTTTLVSANTTGTAASGNFPAISADGRFVAFESSATDIVPNSITANSTNIFATALNGRVNLHASALTVNEATGNASFNVTRTGNTNDVVTVQYTTANGNAEAPEDYTATSGAVVFAAGETSKSIAIPIIDDDIDENDETLLVVLSDFNAGAENPGSLSTAVLTIADDDAPPLISINDVSVVEGNSGTKLAEFTLTLSRESGKVIGLTVAPTSGTAIFGGDFTGFFTNFFIAPGTTSFKASVQIVGDTTFEDDETFTMVLGNPFNVTIARDTGVGTILNDDPLPTISINDVTLAEGKTGTRLFLFTATLSNPSSKTITVQFATADGTALAPGDFAHVSGTLTFTPGTITRFVLVSVSGDPIVEENETFSVNLTNPTEATILDSQGSGTIVNDDAAPVLLIEEGSQRAAALDATLWLRDPFPLARTFFGPDLHTRVSLFVFNLDLVSGENSAAVTVSAEDEFGNIYSLPVEFVGIVTSVEGLSQVVVRLPDSVGNAHELRVKVTLRGQTSNTAPIRIGP